MMMYEPRMAPWLFLRTIVSSPVVSASATMICGSAVAGGGPEGEKDEAGRTRTTYNP